MTTADQIIATAKTRLGDPYVFGAAGPNTFDCSGLVQWVFAQNGIHLPRIAADQSKVGTKIPRGQQQPGDLIFSTWDGSPVPSHVAIYIGNNQFINAPDVGQNVKIGTLNDTYWNHVNTVQRVSGVTSSGSNATAVSTIIPIPGFGAVPVPGLDDIPGVGALQDMAAGVGAIGNLASKLMWLTLPTSQIRIASGAIGVGFLFVGLWFLVREVRK